jgi:hypothetical protein
MRVARSSGLTGKIISHPSGILLLVQLVGVLIYPFMDDTTSGRVGFEIFGVLVLGLAIWVTRESPGPTWIVIVLGVLASALSVADAVNHSTALQGASAICHALFYFWAAGNLMFLHAVRPRSDH